MIKNTRIFTISIVSIIIVCTSAMFGGCGYIAKQGVGFARHQSRAVRIDKMLMDDGALTPETRDFLLRVQDIRSFAIDSIGLKRNKNYTTYVRADRDYMVDVLVASADDTFDLCKWWFPIVGSVPYKGFFSREDAEREAERIKKKGEKKGRVYDVTIGRADAFSTLGFFSDPIYSFMIDYSIYELASLVIHEQTHATIWVKGQAQLNEEIASFIGDEGALWYVRARFGEDSEQYRAAVLQKEDYTTYIDLMRDLYNDLKALYASGVSRSRKLSGKERIFADFRNAMSDKYDSLFRTDRYAGLKTAKLNNAYIASRMTYNLDMSLYYELYECENRDLASAVKLLKELRKVKKDHKGYMRSLLRNRACGDEWRRDRPDTVVTSFRFPE